MSDNLTIFGTDYTNVTGIKAKGTGNGTLTYIRPNGTKSITENGTGINVTQYASVDVAVEDSIDTSDATAVSGDILNNKTAYVNGEKITGTMTNNSGYSGVVRDYEVDSTWDTTYSASGETYKLKTIPTGYHDGNSVIGIVIGNTLVPSNLKSGVTAFGITGTYNGEPTVLQSKTATPTESQQTVTPDSGYDGLSQVTIDAISSTYVGSSITQRTSSDITTSLPSSGALRVIAPAGYYAEQATKDIAERSLPTPTILVNPKTGAITATSKLTNDGYVRSATTTATEQLTLRTSSDLTTSGATVLVPEGYYPLQASMAVASGTAGSPILTKTYIAHDGAILVRADVTNTTGYIEGGTLTESTYVGLSDLGVQGSKTIDSAGSHDVTLYETAIVPSGVEGTPTITKSSVSNHAVTITPSVTNTAGYIEGGTHNGTAITVSASELVSGSQTITTNSTGIDVTNYASVDVNVPIPPPSLQSKSISYTPSETIQSATITADSEYDGLSSVDVSVGAISSTYVGSGITQRTSNDLTASGATVIVPAGYYSAQASKAVASGTATMPTSISATNATIGTNGPGTALGLSKTISLAPEVVSGYIESGTAVDVQVHLQTPMSINSSSNLIVSGNTMTAPAGYYRYAVSASVASGTEGTPTVTKGTVSNHSISVTPSVTNTTGYITGGTKTGTAVTVSASELVSGTYEISASGAHDVTNYASVSIASGSVSSTVTKDTVSNHSVVVHPYADTTQGFIGSGRFSGSTITISASELVSGSQTITANGTGIDVTNYASVDVTVEGTVLPMFTMMLDSSGQVTSVTCDMSYAECAALLENDEPTANIAAIFSDSSAQTWGACGFQNMSSLWYVVLEPSTMEPIAEIQYNYNGTIEATVPPTYIQSLSVTQNGTYSGLYLGVEVNVPAGTPTLQTKTATPTTSQQIIQPDSGYDGLSSVTINAIPSQYVIPTGTINITSSGTKDVTNYANVSVAAGSSTMPSSLSGSSASLTTGTNTLTLTKTISATPVVTAGYINAGTARNVAVTLTASVTTKAATTITPSTSNQTIASGTYLTGTQTIAGDADLVAANIKAGVSIFNVSGSYTSDATASAADIISGKTGYVNGSKITGNLVIQKYYTGSSTPSSSLGNNGDIYVQS